MGKIPENIKEAGTQARSVLPAESGSTRMQSMDGVIVIEVDDRAGLEGGTIELKPEPKNGELSWSCTGGTLSDALRPAECR